MFRFGSLLFVAVALVTPYFLAPARGAASADAAPARQLSWLAQAPEGELRAIVQDAAGFLWLATDRGLHRFDGHGYETFLHDPADPDALAGDDLRSLAVDGDGGLWIAVWGVGLDRFEPRSERFVHYRSGAGSSGQLPDGRVEVVFHDAEGTLWAGTVAAGVSRFDGASGTFVPLYPAGAAASVPRPERVLDVDRDRFGLLWLATGDGVAMYDPASRAGESYRAPAAAAAGGGDGRVAALHVDRTGVLWVGTADGLYRFLRSTRRFERLALTGEPAAAAPPAVDAVFGDSHGTVWVGTRQGEVYAFDPQRADVGGGSARPPGRGGVRTFYEDRSGTLWVGAARGVGKVVLAPPAAAPPVVLTGVRRGNEAVRFDVAPWAVETIALPAHPGHLRFEFTALDPGRPEAYRYRYRLDGLDEEWIDAGVERVAGYTNLAAGRYTFRVQSAPPAGGWSDGGAAVAVEVAGALGRDDWLQLLGGAALLGAFVALYRIRGRRPSARERELAAQVAAGLAHQRESDERYRLLFERNLAGVVRTTVEGEILDCNDAFARILGYASRADCCRRPLDFGPAPRRSGGLLAELRTHGQVVSFEQPVRARDDSWITLLWNAHLENGDGDEAVVIEGTVIDISERRRVEEGMLFTQKLESLGELAGGIAHDFNNLLTAILGQAELAYRDLPEESPARRRLGQIEHAAERAAALAKQMLAYSGRGSFVMEDVDLSALVERAADKLEGSVAKDLVLRYELGRDLPLVEADPAQLVQVLANLVVNAAEAIAEGPGEITLTTGAMRADRGYLRDTYLDEDLAPGRYAFFEVRDNGCGMDRETQAKIFDPFFSTKFTGRGLGLAAVLGIVRGHRGTIRIESAPGRGTVVRVLLPVHEAAPEPTKEPVASGEWHGRGVLLLVDDEEQVRVVGREMAELLGFEVATANDGREGVELFRRRADEIVLVVLDLAMPRLNGAEAYAEMRQIRADVPVLLATGYDEQVTMKQFEDQGFSGFIQKPYRLSDLRAKLRDVLGEDEET